MTWKPLLLIPIALAMSAQAPGSKESPESQIAGKTFQQALDAVSNGWFGKPYREINAVDIQGSMNVTLTPQYLNAKVGELSQGQVKGEMTKGGIVNLKMKGTYFANGDFRTDLTGDFGNLVYTRVGRRGFLYSKEQNCYTTKIDPPPADAPLSFMGWFQQVLNDIQAVYVKGNTFKASMGKEVTVGSRVLQTVILVAPTSSYDPKKREQSLTESLGFWKRGRLELTLDKASKLPERMTFENAAQGVSTQMAFNYGKDGKLLSISLDNQSKGVQGPASLLLTYGGNGLIDRVAGTLTSPRQTVAFDMNLSWNSGKKSSSIVSVPPPGATKKGGQEMKVLLSVGLAGRILDLQRKGLNLRSVTLGNS